ncbi:branched-chain amino acid transport system permease protein [Paucidesulfovibrio gracilis DSM 16080]|uniref:Branched-chain amino acid transport system permease protein n=1 Tax=Paucidesulfovibrio gracilis DSM 16080 TaxID=1121449 RepID=A0A1T4WDI4_9BACT|nr:branched-chain amino acid ABC transporter permease [Paucidesulfovibrio gracilis]SKA75189.1 branched-chain amino acid transport system permease protein [Paucidesulfovibrio gracilis DSM 16080]
MTQGFRKQLLYFLVALVWLFALLWPLLDIRPDGTLGFWRSFAAWSPIAVVITIIFVLYQIKQAGWLNKPFQMLESGREVVGCRLSRVPTWVWFLLIAAVFFFIPQFTERRVHDILIQVLVYICLGLGLNIVIGLCGLLDLGFIAFYGVGAYTYALLSLHYGVCFWLALPVAGFFAMIAGCIIGYPTLRMRGDYLAIVTLGFGEIVRIILNNWMSLTNGPNGVMAKPLTIPMPVFEGGFHIEQLALRSLGDLYYVVFFMAIVVIIAVNRLNFSRIGRAWEAIREDETAAELMGVNTFAFKLMAYAMGAVFGGLAGAFFAARMGFVAPESFTFLESALVLSIVVLGGMGSIPGIILGAFAIIALPEVFREFQMYRMLAFGGAMTFMMLVRPAGLIPAKRMGKRGEEEE